MLEEDFVQPSKKNNSKILPLLGTLVIVGALGYFGYTKYLNTNSAQNTEFPDPAQTMTQTEDATDLPTQDAMPVETVENRLYAGVWKTAAKPNCKTQDLSKSIVKINKIHGKES